MSFRVELSRDEVAQTIITVATALVAARDVEPADATALAVLIIEQAFEAAEGFLYDHGPIPAPAVR